MGSAAAKTGLILPMSSDKTVDISVFIGDTACFQRVFARFVSDKLSDNSAFIGTASAATPAVRRSVAIFVGKSVPQGWTPTGKLWVDD